MIDKKLFTETIEVLQKQEKHDNAFVKHLGKAFPDAFEGNLLYDNSLLTKQIIKLLSLEMKDKEDWIEYYIYELYWGSQYYSGCVKNADGSNIDLSSPEKLYDFLLICRNQ